jgi:hypothetical protein
MLLQPNHPPPQKLGKLPKVTLKISFQDRKYEHDYSVRCIPVLGASDIPAQFRTRIFPTLQEHFSSTAVLLGEADCLVLD